MITPKNISSAKQNIFSQQELDQMQQAVNSGLYNDDKQVKQVIDQAVEKINSKVDKITDRISGFDVEVIYHQDPKHFDIKIDDDNATKGGNLDQLPKKIAKKLADNIINLTERSQKVDAFNIDINYTEKPYDELNVKITAKDGYNESLRLIPYEVAEKIAEYIYKSIGEEKPVKKESSKDDKDNNNERNIEILKTSKKGAMLITDRKKTAWIMPRQRRKDGSFTPGAYKALDNGEPYLTKEEWKENKIVEDYVKIYGNFGETKTGKAIYTTVGIFEYMSEQQINTKFFIPKSLIVKQKEHFVIIPRWFLNVKKQELFEKHETNQFKAHTFSLEVDTDIPEKKELAGYVKGLNVSNDKGMSGAKPRSVKEIMKIDVSQRRKGHSVPMGASLNAQKAIDWLEKYGRKEVTAGTKVGWKRAYQLANGIKLTDDEVKKMAQFNRHRKNSEIDKKYKETPWKDNGHVAWLLWGGDTGVDWAIEKSKELQKEKDDPGMKGVNIDLSDTVKKTADDIMITADQVKEFANRTKETVDAVKKVSTRKKNADSRISNLKGKKGDKDYQFFNVAGQTGQFLQNVERKPKESIAITLDGPQGSGKTTTVWKMMNDFAGGGNDVLFLSLEEHPESFLVQDKIDLYIDDDNLDNIDITGDVDSKEHLYKLIEGYDIIFLDSWQKLLEYVGKIKFDQELRKKVDSKVFVVIFQQTVQGKTKGGADIGFDGDIIIKLHKDETGNFANNYAYFDKHRYTKKPIDKLKYYIASGQFVDETQQQPAPAEQAQPYNDTDDLVVSL